MSAMNNSDILYVDNGAATSPSYSFTIAPGSGTFLANADGTLGFAVAGVQILQLNPNGFLSLNTTGYENLVTSGNIIPNKNYIDNKTWSASSIISGTLPVSIGGTGANTLTSGMFLTGNGTSAVVTTKAVPTGTVLGT